MKMADYFYFVIFTLFIIVLINVFSSCNQKVVYYRGEPIEKYVVYEKKQSNRIDSSNVFYNKENAEFMADVLIQLRTVDSVWIKEIP